MPVALQRAVPAPVNGLPAGMPPSGVMRRILPSRMFWSRDASFWLPQPLSNG